MDDLDTYTHAESQTAFIRNPTLNLAASALTEGDVTITASVDTAPRKNGATELAFSLVRIGTCGTGDDSKFQADSFLKLGADDRKTGTDATGGNDIADNFDTPLAGQRTKADGQLDANGVAYNANVEGALGDETCWAYPADDLDKFGGEGGLTYGTAFDNAQLEANHMKDPDNGVWNQPVLVTDGDGDEVARYTTAVELSHVRDNCENAGTTTDDITTFNIAVDTVRPSQHSGSYPSSNAAQNIYHTTCMERTFSVGVTSSMNAVVGGAFSVQQGASFKVQDVDLVQCNAITADGYSADIGGVACPHTAEHDCDILGTSGKGYQLRVKVQHEFEQTGQFVHVGLTNTQSSAGSVAPARTAGSGAFVPAHGLAADAADGAAIRGKATATGWSYNKMQFGRGGFTSAAPTSRSAGGKSYTSQVHTITSDCINLKRQDGQCNRGFLQGIADFSIQMRFQKCDDIQCLTGGSKVGDASCNCADLKSDIDGDTDNRGLNFAGASDKYFPLTITLAQESCPLEFTAVTDGSQQLESEADIAFFDDVFHPKSLRKSLLDQRGVDVAEFVLGAMEHKAGRGFLPVGTNTYLQGRTAVAALYSETDLVSATHTAWLTDVKLCQLSAAPTTDAQKSCSGTGDSLAIADKIYTIVKDGEPQSAFGTSSTDFFQTQACKYAMVTEHDSWSFGTSFEQRCPDASNSLGSSNAFYSNTDVSFPLPSGSGCHNGANMGCGRGEVGARLQCGWDINVPRGGAAWDAISFQTDYMLDATATANVISGDLETHWLLDMSADTVDCSAGEPAQRRLRATQAYTFSVEDGARAEASAGFTVVRPRDVGGDVPTAQPTMGALTPAQHEEHHDTLETYQILFFVLLGLVLVVPLLYKLWRKRRQKEEGGMIAKASKYRTRSVAARNPAEPANVVGRLTVPSFRTPVKWG